MGFKKKTHLSRLALDHHLLSVVMETDGDHPDPTYGQRAPEHITSLTLTANQFQQLEPRISDYVKLDRAERASFALESFRLVWNGEDIQWDMKSLWPSKADNARWHREKKVCGNNFNHITGVGLLKADA